MFKDKLDNSKFTLTNKKNYRVPTQLNLVRVKKEIENLGYEVVKIDQIFRNVHAKIKRDKKYFFLKLASTKDISERLKNEINWNLTMNAVLKIKNFSLFSVPRVYDFGEIMGYTYYISDFFENDFLASKNPPTVLCLDNFISQIAETSIFIMNLPLLPFLRDISEFTETSPIFCEFYAMDSKLITDLPEHELEEVLQYEKNFFDKKETCVNHGDFVPWHMIKNGENFVLIDGEHGSSKLPYGYDIAYFYHAVFTRAESPKIADEYLKLVYKNVSQEKKEKFIEYFYACLANRIISGFWHAKNENKDFHFHQEIKKKFISKEII